MPTPYIEKMAEEGKGSILELEKKWNIAKNLAKKEGKTDNYAYITGIFKKMIGETYTFKEFITKKYEETN